MRASGPARLVVVSPHLDDAVFGAGRLLAAQRGSLVVTVFAGLPPAGLATEWDRRCGFADGRAAMRARREEDRAALRPLSAHAHWLDFLDAQYAPPPPVGTVAGALAPLLAGAGTIAAPLGLFHSDHALVHEACLALHARAAAPQWLFYEDALYRRKPGLLQQRLVALARRGLEATPAFPAQGPLSLKEGAVQSYASQLRAFGTNGYADVEAPERYWALTARPSVVSRISRPHAHAEAGDGA